MARSFSERLTWCMEKGDLTISDLSRWFDRPRATVNTWVNGRTPFGPSGRLATHHLGLLEEAVRSRHFFPVPEELSWRDRMVFIRGRRNDAERHTRVPNLRTAG